MDESEPAMDQRGRKSLRELVRETVVTAVAVVAPLLVTAIVLAIALQSVHDYLSLFDRTAVAGDGKNDEAGEPPPHRSIERRSAG